MNSLRRETWLSLAMVLATVGCTTSKGRPLTEPKVELAGQAAESPPQPKLFPRSGLLRDPKKDWDDQRQGAPEAEPTPPKET